MMSTTRRLVTNQTTTNNDFDDGGDGGDVMLTMIKVGSMVSLHHRYTEHGVNA